VISVHGSARALAQALPGLQVDAQRMRGNIDAVRASVSMAAADEWFHPGLAKHAGDLALAQLQLMRELR